MLDRVRALRSPSATTITLSGNGRLTPAEVTEAQDRPRRLVLDFPNVSSRAPLQTIVEGPLVKRVRVAVNSREPLLTRVVMDLSDATTYHVERAGTGGSDLAVVFEAAQSPSAVLVAKVAGDPLDDEPEPDIPIEQAIANAAHLTPTEIPAAERAAPAPARLRSD